MCKSKKYVTVKVLNSYKITEARDWRLWYEERY